MLLMGLIGRARAGKSTAAEAILEHCSRTGISCAIADIGEEVRRHCVEIGALPEKPRSQLSPAELAVLIAEGRKQRRWIDRAVERHADKKVVIVPNCRYWDEVDFLRARQGILVRITRLQANGLEFISADRDPSDRSECELLGAPADFTLVNQEPWLLRRLAVTLFEYLQEKPCSVFTASASLPSACVPTSKTG